MWSVNGRSHVESAGRNGKRVRGNRSHPAWSCVCWVRNISNCVQLLEKCSLISHNCAGNQTAQGMHSGISFRLPCALKATEVWAGEGSSLANALWRGAKRTGFEGEDWQESRACDSLESVKSQDLRHLAFLGRCGHMWPFKSPEKQVKTRYKGHLFVPQSQKTPQILGKQMQTKGGGWVGGSPPKSQGIDRQTCLALHCSVLVVSRPSRQGLAR